MVAKSNEIIEADLANIAQVAKDTHGIEDGDAKIQRFRDLIAKWEGLLPLDKEWTEAEVAEVFRTEIFAKIDPATYGQ